MVKLSIKIDDRTGDISKIEILAIEKKYAKRIFSS